MIHSSMNSFPTKYKITSLTCVLHAVRDVFGTEIQILVGPMDAAPDTNSSPQTGKSGHEYTSAEPGSLANFK